MQTTTIRKWGNSYALRLPVAAVKKFGLREGQAVRLEESRDGRALRLVPATLRSESLAQLIDRITPLNRHPALPWDRPRGKEAW